MARVRRFFTWTVGSVFAVAIAYGGAALASAVFFVEAGGQAIDPGEPEIMVCATAVHADLLLPLHDLLIDWNQVLPGAIPENMPADGMIAFGWGDLVLFRDVPEWSDLSGSVAVAAIAGLHETALRVAVTGPHPVAEGCAPVHASKDARGKLIAYILATLKRAPDGRPVRLGLAPGASLYTAEGRYSPFHTCNQWVANGLAAADLPHARFAPFSFGVLWPMEKQASGDLR